MVDDDERIRGLLQKFLIRSGFLVTTARDAAQARRVLAGLEFDLIVLDVMMPGEDGFTLTRELRGKMQTPFLLLTAKGETGNRIRGAGGGADDYLVKPFGRRSCCCGSMPSCGACRRSRPPMRGAEGASPRGGAL